MSDLTWTEPRITRLKELYAAGSSASQIANDLAGGITRNAVIGKILRLKLPPRGRRLAAAKPDKPAAPPRPKPGKLAAIAQMPTFRPKRNPSNDPKLQQQINAAEPGIDANLTGEPDGRGIKLIELNNVTCRWPFGDPLKDDFMFCGEPSANLEDKRPYCPFHSARAVDRSGTVRSAMRAKHAVTAAG